MSVIKLKPACQDYMWGGHRLKKEYGIEDNREPIAEAWVLSCHPDGPSLVDSGEYRGITLNEYIRIKGNGILGKNAGRFPDFPVLIKLIDAKKDLSIQVHPDDEYALRIEGQNGKTEVWFVLDAAEGAFIYYGFKSEISKEELEERIRDNTLTEVLSKVYVKKGDLFFLAPGTLHAIGAGVLLAEVQQNSNITYRIYDYDRVGADGKKRPLHIEKALDVTDRKPPEPYKGAGDCLASCDYFKTVFRELSETEGSYELKADGDSFYHILVLSGQGSISSGEEEFSFKKGDSFFVEADTGEASITGTAELLITTV